MKINISWLKKNKDVVAIIVVVLLVVVYIITQCYSVTHIELKTQTAEVTTVYDGFETNALVVRNEQLIDTASSGVTVPCLNDGDKVNVDGNIAMQFSDSNAATSYSKYTELQEKLDYYEDLESQSVGEIASIESIDNDIDSDVDSYIRAMAGKDTDTVSTAGNEVNEGIFRRQTVIGQDVDIVTSVQKIRQQMDKYSSSAKPQKYIKTDVSGIYSSHTDGYENLVDYSKATSLTAKQVNSYINKVAKQGTTASNNIGKLITSYDWYLISTISSSDAKKIDDGDTVDVALKDSDDTVLKATVIKSSNTKNSKEVVLVLQCNAMDTKLASIRTADIEVRSNKYEGIKVPTSALHVVDGKKGVYVLISSQVKFRQADVIYSNDDYVLLDYDNEKVNGIRIYDKIITQGKDLEDGKVYT